MYAFRTIQINRSRGRPLQSPECFITVIDPLGGGVSRVKQDTLTSLYANGARCRYCAYPMTGTVPGFVSASNTLPSSEFKIRFHSECYEKICNGPIFIPQSYSIKVIYKFLNRENITGEIRRELPVKYPNVDLPLVQVILVCPREVPDILVYQPIENTTRSFSMVLSIPERCYPLKFYRWGRVKVTKALLELRSMLYRYLSPLTGDREPSYFKPSLLKFTGQFRPPKGSSVAALFSSDEVELTKYLLDSELIEIASWKLQRIRSRR